MERFFIDIENINTEKAKELYTKVCVSIVEENGLKEKAFEMTIKICDKHIEEQTEKDRKRHPLLWIAPTWKNIKNAVMALSKN